MREIKMIKKYMQDISDLIFKFEQYRKFIQNPNGPFEKRQMREVTTQTKKETGQPEVSTQQQQINNNIILNDSKSSRRPKNTGTLADLEGSKRNSEEESSEKSLFKPKTNLSK